MEAGLREPVVHVGDLKPTRDFSDVRDIVRGYWLLLERGTPGEVYNLCSGLEWSIERLLNFLIGKSTVPHIEIRQDPARLRPSDVPVLRGVFALGDFLNAAISFLLVAAAVYSRTAERGPEAIAFLKQHAEVDYEDSDDGLTAAALLLRFLSALGAPARLYVPDRLREGTVKALGAGLARVAEDVEERASRVGALGEAAELFEDRLCRVALHRPAAAPARR